MVNVRKRQKSKNNHRIKIQKLYMSIWMTISQYEHRKENTLRIGV